MKKLSFHRSLKKAQSKCETSATSEPNQVAVAKTRWSSRLEDAKRALSRKAKGFPSPLSSSSTPCLFSTAPPPPKRAPSTTLTLRSKSMTAELEELGECQNAGIQTPSSSSPRPLLRFLPPPIVIKALCVFLTFRTFSHNCWLVLYIFSPDTIFLPPSFCSETKRR